MYATSPPPRVWVLPHRRGTRGEPSVRPLLAETFGIPADDLPLRRDPRGRPRLQAPLQRYDLGWSHSGDALLLAVGEGVTLGVDIERAREHPRALEIAQRFFHQDETAWLHSLQAGARAAAFTRLWCAKEALLKAHGHGIAFGLDKLVFADEGGALRLRACDAALGAPGDWTLREWQPLPDYRAAMAWKAA
jgi:4'-phosphopantetheinyl transferase